MINQPDTLDLLSTARQALLEELVPALEGDGKYSALMIANAMGMAIRELEQREQGEPAATDQALVTFLQEKGEPNDGVTAEDALTAAIRARRLDGSDEALRSMLRRLTETRLRINNPGYLK